jgi:hypothetical protein
MMERVSLQIDPNRADATRITQAVEEAGYVGRPESVT